MAIGGPISERSDKELVLDFQGGDSIAYEEIYRRHSGRLFGLCYRMLRSSADAEEAVQETFMKAYQNLGAFNGRYHLGAWLNRIASNVCVDQIRVRRRAAERVALESDDYLRETDRGPEEIVVGDYPRIHEAIEEIQPVHARALELRLIQGLSHKEMAGKLSMTPAQVKALLHRARGSLRRAWDKAEGWMIAPGLALRSLLSDKRHQDSMLNQNLITVGQTSGAIVVDRVATSAVVVVMALSGLSFTVSDKPEAPSRHGRKVAQAAPERKERAKHSGRDAKKSRADKPEAASDASTVVEEEDPLGTLTGGTTLSIEEPPDPSTNDDEDDDDDGGGVGPADKDAVVKQAGKTIEEVLDGLPQR